MNADTLSIECQVTIEDLAAWNNYYLQNSLKTKKTYKWVMRIGLIASIVAFLGGVALVIMGNDPAVPSDDSVSTGVFTAIIGLFGLLYFSFLPKIMHWIQKRAVNNLYKKGQNIVLGVHKYSISSEGINDKTELADNNVKWGAVENVSVTDKHIFIRLPPNMAFIIPKRTFPDDASFKQFFEDTQKIFQAAKTTN